MTPVHVRRLGAADRTLARRTFATIADVFGTAPTGHPPPGDAYLDALLARPDFWAFAALAPAHAAAADDDIADDLSAHAVVGGLTAHALPMTSAERSELFIFDLAVRPEWQRRGVGRALMAAARAGAAAAGLTVAFVPAEDEDAHALAFYAAVGGTPTATTIFTFACDADPRGSTPAPAPDGGPGAG